MEGWAHKTNRSTRKRKLKNSDSYVVKMLLRIGRITAIVPIVDTDSATKCTDRPADSNYVYPIVVVFVVHGVSLPAALWFYLQYGSSSIVLNFYFFHRAFTAAFIHILCLWKRILIRDGLRKTLRLKVTVRRRFLLIPITVISAFCVNSLVYFVSVFKSPIKILKALPLALVSHLISVILISLFICQVESIRKCIVSLYDEIEHLLSTESPFNGRILCNVIKKYSTLYSISVILNEAYGIPLLLSTFQVLLEAIVCTKQFTEYPTERHGVSCLIWSLIIIFPVFWAMHVCQKAEDSVCQIHALSTYLRTKLTDRRIPHTSLIQIRQWEIQIKQQPIKFGASGFFIFNGMHIETVTSTIITYIIILMQNDDFNIGILINRKQN